MIGGSGLVSLAAEFKRDLSGDDGMFFRVLLIPNSPNSIQHLMPSGHQLNLRFERHITACDWELTFTPLTSNVPFFPDCIERLMEFQLKLSNRILFRIVAPCLIFSFFSPSRSRYPMGTSIVSNPCLPT